VAVKVKKKHAAFLPCFIFHTIISLMQQLKVPGKCSKSLLHLPTELIIEVMIHLERVDLESFLNLVDFPLQGVVQYATGPGTELSGNENKETMSVSLDDLNQSYSMINIVDIVGMDSVNDALISQMCKALSHSMNHVSISQTGRSVFDEYSSSKSNRVLELINSLPDSSEVVIKDSRSVRLNDGQIDLRRVSFQNINYLWLKRCDLQGGGELQMSNVVELVLVDFSDEMINSINLEACNNNLLCLWGAAVKLQGKTINTQVLACNGGADLQSVKFTGTCFTFCALQDGYLITEGFEAPNLYEMKILFGDEFPRLINFNAPMLHRVELSSGINYGRQGIRQLQEKDLTFLQQIRELELSSFVDPLLKVDLHRLTKLVLRWSRREAEVERVFPSLKELVVTLSFVADSLPVIKAENLENLEISVQGNFVVDSIVPTIRRYPLLKRFSFKNCRCSFFTRRRVEIMVYWMKWQTPCNLEVVHCSKVVWPCHHRILGFFGL
jgi:hypothetical protein